MTLRTGLMRFLGKDKGEPPVWWAVLVGMGSNGLWAGLFGDNPSSLDAGISAGAILLAVVWIVWLVGFKKSLQYLAIVVIAAAAVALLLAGLDRLGLSWLPVVVTAIMFFTGIIIAIFAVFEWLASLMG